MNARKALFYALAILLGGCVPVVSVYPLYGDKDVVFDERLVGAWTGNPDQPSEQWLFERHSDPALKNTYLLALTDGEGHKGLLQARLVKLEGKLFLDVYPETPPSGSNDWANTPLPLNMPFFAAVHSFTRIEFGESGVTIKMTINGEFKKFLAEHPDAVACHETQDRILITAPTRELQAFVLKYADDERLFPGKIELTRKALPR
ncbi:MAG TPA: hypothetical protein ENN81_03050 [Phycisphaerales bacterium]|nr:hypothetical protein [Phycisphaerales bacterium]